PHDMPVNGLRVTLRVHVRRFFCANPHCPRRTFAERFPSLLAPDARRTRPLDDWLTHVAFALGGEAGARLLDHPGVNICGDPLLACIRAFIVADPPVPQVLSVDDVAFRCGRIDGSILVRVPSGWHGAPLHHPGTLWVACSLIGARAPLRPGFWPI